MTPTARAPLALKLVLRTAETDLAGPRRVSRGRRFNQE
jgi:hypothetical protein